MHLQSIIYSILFATNTKAFVAGGVLINISTSSFAFLFDSLDFHHVAFSTMVFAGKCVFGGAINLGIKKALDNKIFKGGKPNE